MSSSTVLLILLLTIVSTRAVVTNEDIRVAILQIVNVVRSTDDKLERHEYRDRVVGEQLKKGMINIDKRIKMLDPLKGTVGRLDERLAAVETILIQKNEREKMQLQRTYEAVIDIQKNLPVIMEEFKNDIIAKLSTHEPPAQIMETVMSKKDFEKMEKEVLNKIDKVTNSISNLEKELTKIKTDGKQFKDLNSKSSENLEKLNRHINDNQQLLTKYDKKLAEYNKSPEASGKISKEQDEWKLNVLKALDGQKSNVKEILLDLKNLHNKVNQLPHRNDLKTTQNSSLDDIRRTINDIKTNLNNTNDDTMKNLNGLTEISAILVKSVANANNALDGEKSNVKNILQSVQNIQDTINQLPRKDDLSVVQGATLKKLDELTNDVLRSHQNPSTDAIRRTQNEINNNLNKFFNDITKNLTKIANDINQNSGSKDKNPEVGEILAGVKNLQNQVNQLPQKYDLNIAQNTSLKKLEELNSRTEPIFDKIRIELEGVNNNLNKSHDDTMRNLNDLSEITETLAERFGTNYGKIHTDIQALSKIDQVMIKTADDVLDTKRRLEYGVHQILGELGKQLKETTKNINQGVSDRFDIFEAGILDEETGALANITSKIGADILQVWRQIGIMYQQINKNANTLDHLQNITDTYVNGSLGAIDNMKGKVGQITGRMTEVDENLNYLLGRLSLVTQEFDRIKTGLGAALDQIRDSFHAVQEKIKDTGPGPHQIPANEIPPEK